MEIKTLRNIFIGMILGALLMGVGGVLTYKFIGKVEDKLDVVKGAKEVVDEESVVTKVVEKATPSVVTVSISKTNIGGGNMFPGWDIFGDFFGVRIISFRFTVAINRSANFVDQFGG